MTTRTTAPAPVPSTRTAATAATAATGATGETAATGATGETTPRRSRRGTGGEGRCSSWPWRVLPGGSPSGALEHLALAALAFVPLLLVDRGIVSSDTKSYLYLDPARFLRQVASMWYPTVALGTVTHQYIGYLFPMGPYYALASEIHLHTWIAQRLWLGGILFGAGAGVLYLCRALGVQGPGRVVAALTFMWSPYVLQYSGRISVILMPWAALPWLIAFTVLALRERKAPSGATEAAETAGAAGAAKSAGAAETAGAAGATEAAEPAKSAGAAGSARASRVTGAAAWRYPALFALVVALTSGINASSVLYVALGPLLWLVWAVTVERDAAWRDAAVVLARVCALSVLVSAWWIAGLVVEAGYGVDILRYTESVEATSSTSTPLEVLRGLGYWYFYGSGRTGPWTQSVLLYTRWIWLVALSYLVPVTAFVSGVLVRWRHRGYFVGLVVVGVVLSVGAYPYAHPTAVGGLLKAFMNDTTAGLAMRSTDRATPLALLGLAMLLGAGTSALWRRRAWAGRTAAAALCGLVLANNPALFNGDAAVVDGLTQPARLPAYDLAAARYLDSVHTGTRVLAIPGNAFAAYTWGDTNDTPQPALLTRPFVTREQQVMGSMATADTLYAIDEPIQAGTEDWSALAPMARLVSAGDVLVEYDQTSARYGAPQAVTLARSLETTPSGLSLARTFGSPGQRVAKPTVDAELLAGTASAKPPPPVVIYTVHDPRPIVRAEPDTGALVVAGDATGLETLAAQGLLDTTSAIYYAGTLDGRPFELRTLVEHGATLVVTDTNRKQSFRWNGLSTNAGQVETVRDDTTTRTPSSSPIDLFSPSTDPTAATGSRTVATYVGAADVTASSYGNPVSYEPDQRPYSAIDGDLRTAWETGTYVPDVDGQWWQVAFGHRVSADHVTLVQPLYGTRKRAISEVTLTFTGRHPVEARLGAASRRASGQRVEFSRRTFETLRVTIDKTTSDHGTPVGFAEVEVPGQRVVEIERMPTDLLSRLGASSLRDRLVISMARTRTSPYTTTRTDTDTILARSFTLPTSRTFTLSGTATLSPYLGDDEIARLVGVPGSTGSGVVATSSSRLTGALGDTAGAPVSGSGIWQSAFGARKVAGAWLQYRLASPITFDRLSLGVVADRRHSLPETITVSAATTARRRVVRRRVALPVIRAQAAPGSTVTVPVSFRRLTGNRIRITFDHVSMARDALAGRRHTEVLPLGVAALQIPGLHVPPPPLELPGTCRSDLLRIDGRPVSVRVVGTTATALDDGQVSIEPCGADARVLRLPAGRNVVESALATAPVHPTTDSARTAARAGEVPDVPGWNVDELTLSSPPGGAPPPGAPPAGAPPPGAPSPGPGPRVSAHETSATSWSLNVRHVTGPFELVLGESLDAGWHAVASPGPGAPRGSHAVTLGSPQLVDAFANGWQVTGRDLRELGVRPGARGAARGQEASGFAVSLVWTPQRDAWAGIAISGASILGCLALIVVAWRPRRARARRARRRELMQRSPSPSLASPGGGADRAARRLRWWAVVGAAAATGGLGAAISTPWSGLALAISVAAGLVSRRLRLLGALGAVGLLAAAGALVVVGQVLHPVPAGGNWPAAYHLAATLAATAVAFLGADAVVDYVTTPAPSGTG